MNQEYVLNSAWRKAVKLKNWTMRAEFAIDFEIPSLSLASLVD